MVDKNELQQHADGIITRAKNILTAPAATWDVVAKETDEPMQVFLKYALPLILIGPIAAFIGGMVFGIGGLYGVTIRPGLSFLVTQLVTSIVLGLATVWLMAFIANLVSKGFDGRDDFPAAFRLIAYSWTAAWLAAIFAIIPALAILGIVGLYSLYLLYKGATPVMGVPEEKSVVYTIIVIIVAIVTYIIIGALTVAITGPAMINSSINIGSNDTVIDDDFNMSIDSDYGNVEIREENGQATIKVDGAEMKIAIPEDE